ncbi:MAG: nitrite reductase, copper-containing [Candidatus Nomurabacteria bacterium]|nr:nitrite reductase, copper-containing [Candidatus Nomurabacteria bacterium]USN88003.1 MAG: nitrite reductase, copper-containing [Candidatus Nomurabacteria bacterium]
MDEEKQNEGRSKSFIFYLIIVASIVLVVVLLGALSFFKIFPLIQYELLQKIGILLLIGSSIFFVARVAYRFHSKPLAISMALFITGGIFYVWGDETHPPHFAMPAFMHSYHPGGHTADLPFRNVLHFFQGYSNFEWVDDIGADPNAVPPPIDRDWSETVKVSLVTQEVISEVADEVYFNYWTFNKQVPGPMLRVREGDTVEMTITNHESSLHGHNIDLHAVTGPGGGATLSFVEPGETKQFSWKALNPGLYIYHCASPNVSTHNSHGQYGLILVEPKEGLPPVDKEFYLVQGELYTKGALGKKGLTVFDSEALLDGNPNYVTFNGRIEKDGEPRMKVKTGEKVRIYVGNGGVNLISSFHPIGEIFDLVYAEGGIGALPLQNIQTTAVLPGGASIVEFTAEVPGNIILVDHALARMNKGAWAIIKVEGDPRPDIFAPTNEFVETSNNDLEIDEDVVVDSGKNLLDDFGVATTAVESDNGAVKTTD